MTVKSNFIGGESYILITYIFLWHNMHTVRSDLNGVSLLFSVAVFESGLNLDHIFMVLVLVEHLEHSVLTCFVDCPEGLSDTDVKLGFIRPNRKRIYTV